MSESSEGNSPNAGSSTGRLLRTRQRSSSRTLNKLANPQDAHFFDTFLVVTPGITIRDLPVPFMMNLLIEVTGEKKKDKAAKVATARNLWVPAVNNHGGFGRWAFIEVDDPWNAETLIRKSLVSLLADDSQSLALARATADLDDGAAGSANPRQEDR